MHLGYPVRKAVEYQALDDGLICLQCVARAGEVGVLGFVWLRM